MSKLDVWERVLCDVLFKSYDWQGTPKGQRFNTERSCALGATGRYLLPCTAHAPSSPLREILPTR